METFDKHIVCRYRDLQMLTCVGNPCTDMAEQNSKRNMGNKKKTETKLANKTLK